MSTESAARIAPELRRRALKLGYVNGILWSVGNGLTTGTLVYYLVLDLGAEGIEISLILAAPALVGLLRLFAPALIRLLGSAKATCLALSIASYILLCGLPAMAFPGFATGPHALPILIGVLCVHQLLEYIASVALWAWFGDLVPLKVRGRYFGRRQVYQLIVLIPTLLISGYFADWWKETHSQTQPEWALLAYAIPSALGVLFLLASLIPLVFMPATPVSRADDGPRIWRSITLPLADRRFAVFLLFGCWFSFFNGVTQSAQNIYPYRVLGFGVLALAVMRTVMRIGQIPFAFFAGGFSDRYGNRPVLILTQAIVATGPLFFLLARPGSGSRWWLLGAWIAWSAFGGMNVCLPNLTLKLAPDGQRASYLASWFAFTSIAYAVSTIAGGKLFDVLADRAPFTLGSLSFDHYDLLFATGWVTRTMALIWLWFLIEPGAWRWRDIVRRDASRNDTD